MQNSSKVLKKRLPATRASPYSKREKYILLTCIQKHKKTVENVRTDAVGRRKKDEAWNSITEEYNALCEKHGIFDPKSKPQLKRCWENMKSRTRKNDSDKKQYEIGTGGGPAFSEEQDAIDSAVRSIKPSIDFTLENPYDSTSAFEDHTIIEHIDLTADNDSEVSLEEHSEIDDMINDLLNSDEEMESDEEYLKNLPDFTDDLNDFNDSSNEMDDLADLSVQHNSIAVGSYNCLSSTNLGECKEKKCDDNQMEQTAGTSTLETSQQSIEIKPLSKNRVEQCVPKKVTLPGSNHNVTMDSEEKHGVQGKVSKTPGNDASKNGQLTHTLEVKNYEELRSNSSMNQISSNFSLYDDSKKLQKLVPSALNSEKVHTSTASRAIKIKSEKNYETVPSSCGNIKSEKNDESDASTAARIKTEKNKTHASSAATMTKSGKSKPPAPSTAASIKSEKEERDASCSVERIKSEKVDPRISSVPTIGKSANNSARAPSAATKRKAQENVQMQLPRSVIKFAPQQNIKSEGGNKSRIPLSPVKSGNSNMIEAAINVSTLNTAKTSVGPYPKKNSNIIRSTSGKNPKKQSTTNILAKRLRQFEAITANDEVAGSLQENNSLVSPPRRNQCSTPKSEQDDRRTLPRHENDCSSSARRQRNCRLEKAAHQDEVHAAKMKILEIEMECAMMKKNAVKLEQETHQFKKQLAEQQFNDYFLAKIEAASAKSDQQLK